MAASFISQPVGKRISCKHFFESMKLVQVAFILLMLMVPVYGQQTAADWYNKGNDWNTKDIAFQAQGMPDEAIQAYDEALKLDSNLTEVWFKKGVALFYKGEYEKAASSLAKAINDCDEAIKLNPNDYMAWFHKGDAIDYSVLGNSKYSHDVANLAYEEAVKACDEVIKQDQNDSVAWNYKGLALEAQSKDDEAIQAYDKAIEINPQYAEAWFNKGCVLPEENDSIKAYDKVIELDPKNAEAWFNKGITHGNQGNDDEAIKCYDEVIRLVPKNVNAWLNKANALSSLGKYDEAIKNFDKIFVLDPQAESDWYLWDYKAGIQKENDVARTYYLKDFYTLIDGNGVTFFLSFMGEDGKTYAIPDGRLLITLYRGKSSTAKIYNHLYDIKKSDYGDYVGGIAIKKWISFEEMSISKAPSSWSVSGRFGFQDVKGLVSTARKETQP